MTKTYKAEFFTRADWASRNFEAKTPKQALKLARQFYDEHLEELAFASYGDADEVEQVQIWDDKRGTVASWESGDYRLRLAGPDLLKALEEQTDAAQAVIDSWERGDLAGAVRALDASIETARAALAKAAEGQP